MILTTTFRSDMAIYLSILDIHRRLAEARAYLALWRGDKHEAARCRLDAMAIEREIEMMEMR